jgi:hypothetical protein
MNNSLPIERIESKIYLIRGQKVMPDSDLAKLYGVTTGRLNEQVKRNQRRFPIDFMFRLTEDEYRNLISQIAISNQLLKKRDHGGRRNSPLAFTEPGVAMLSSVLRSKQAISINILIMCAFIKLRQALATHVKVSRKLKELEAKVDKHDIEIGQIFEAIKQMIAVEEKPKPKIGFRGQDGD